MSTTTNDEVVWLSGVQGHTSPRPGVEICSILASYPVKNVVAVKFQTHL
jgi:hypothetical protein